VNIVYIGKPTTNGANKMLSKETKNFLNDYTVTTPMSGNVFVKIGMTSGYNTIICTVKTIAGDETQVKVNDVVLVLEDNIVSFDFNDRYYRQIKTSDILCILSKKATQVASETIDQ
jgi:hypothetical protein